MRLACCCELIQQTTQVVMLWGTASSLYTRMMPLPHQHLVGLAAGRARLVQPHSQKHVHKRRVLHWLSSAHLIHGRILLIAASHCNECGWLHALAS